MHSSTPFQLIEGGHSQHLENQLQEVATLTDMPFDEAYPLLIQLMRRRKQAANSSVASVRSVNAVAAPEALHPASMIEPG